MTRNILQYNIRHINETDLPVLAGIKKPTATHKDRLRDADGDKLLYLAILYNDMIIGFGLLVFERPAAWPPATGESHVPAIADLHVRKEFRSRGAGSFLINWMEQEVINRNGKYLYTGVDPVDNDRAYQLYLRLGYKPLQTQPYICKWEFTDSDGNLHKGKEWNLDMIKYF